jgi:hypothetical protein
MKYKIIFTLGYIDDEEAIYRGNRGDILIINELGEYYDPYFITLESIKGEFTSNKVCYLWDKMVIVHELTTDNILKSIFELEKWLFQKRWIPLKDEDIEKHYFPKEDWIVYEVETDNVDS